ncbi:hypothetical protein BRO54_0191 [Geobacillus proteiniphilus]|uniref:Uncharacterized protein n=1 Tax=Geobacillus proteiniphilus TaxID=860353 RepID=A0A1Q5TAH9_9BACL|nr:hypothetical protein BRO54_0191 [Geobacillus proteiniphilus]
METNRALWYNKEVETYSASFFFSLGGKKCGVWHSVEEGKGGLS